MRNFQPRAGFNPKVEISVLFELPGLKFLPWVEICIGNRVGPSKIKSVELLDEYEWKSVFAMYDK